MKQEEGAARCPLCSQNAHDETVLVPCAQSRAALATPLKSRYRELEGPRWTRATQEMKEMGSLYAFTLLRLL